MVLAELGTALRDSLRKLSTSTVISEEILNAILNDIARALISSDVNIKLVAKLKNAIKSKVLEETNGELSTSNSGASKKLVQKVVMEELTNLLNASTKPYVLKKNKPNVIMFVGLQGAGKTTTIAKYAAYYARKGWRVSMVCCDSFRAGAFDQLKQNATKLRVPFYGSYTEADPVVIATNGVKQFKDERFEIILIDTSGRHRQEEALFEEMQQIVQAIKPDNTVFVMDATQGQAIADQAQSFHDAVDVGSVIVTKLDGHAKGGGAISAVAATNSPIIFLGLGEHFDDLEVFNSRSFVSKLLGYGDSRGLMDEMKDVRGASKEEARANAEKLLSGKSTLRDFYGQLGQMAKLGPMSKVMGMVPGMGNMGAMAGMGGNMDKMFKKFKFAMDSMTDSELDGVIDFAKIGREDRKNRVHRIARGSGVQPAEVELLLASSKMFQGMFGGIGGGKNMPNASKMESMRQQMKRNPNAMMKQMDPAMIKKMGGEENVKKQMADFVSGKSDGMGDLMGMGRGAPSGGMPDMSSMGSMMGNMFGGGSSGAAGGMPQMPPGMDMAKMQEMMQQMGGGR